MLIYPNYAPSYPLQCSDRLNLQPFHPFIFKTFQKKFDTRFFCLIFALPFKRGTDELVAQLVEQYTFNVWALGSSPSQFTNAVSK